MTKITEFEPVNLWKFFHEICKIPRPSSKEDKVINYIIDLGKRNNLTTLKDKTGNILIRKDASPGCETKMSVCLQSHLDMVAEKRSCSNHNFEKDPIHPVIEDGWVKATDTTLGADNGIGVASQLAILLDNSIEHGPIECLFTVEEETGLTGAFNLDPGFLKSNILINLDSEDEGELFIGCAGGMDTIARLKYKDKKCPTNYLAFKISINNLKGGHSGDDINKGRGNSIKILNRFLWTLSRRIKIRLNKFEGGNLRNAIPRDAYAIIAVEQKNAKKLENELNQFIFAIKNEFGSTEPDIHLEMKPEKLPDSVLRKKFQRRLLNAIYGCPHGVIKMSPEMKDMVETSTNLASVKFTRDNTITITTSQRSSIESGKQNIANSVRSIFELSKAYVEHTSGYPGWKPNINSEILKVTKKSYKKLFGIDPLIKSIHAGLECGLFLEKYPYLDMVSFGPTICGAHSPDERVEIQSVKKYWDLLLDVLKSI